MSDITERIDGLHLALVEDLSDLWDDDPPDDRLRERAFEAIHGFAEALLSEEDPEAAIRDLFERLNKLHGASDGDLFGDEATEMLVPFVIEAARTAGLTGDGDPTFAWRDF